MTGTFGLLLLLSGCSGGSTELVEELVVTSAPAPEPVFEPAGSPGLDSFFPLNEQFTFGSGQLDDANSEAATDVAVESAVAATIFDPAALGIATLAIPQPTAEQVESGLYGGTAENTCDPERLIQYLLENPDKGQVWADVQGIRFVDIPDYIRTLTPTVLEQDRVVLNHGFDPRGHAIPIVSTLAKGTAVLVDENGDVRTRCYCGNPILPYVPVDYEPPKCLDFYSIVYIAPNERTTIKDVPRSVRGTNNIATFESVRWAEISWEGGTGWVRAHEADDRYCKPIELIVCVGGADVFAKPTSPRAVGRVDRSQVSLLTPDVQGWSLIKFIGTSGWIQTDQINVGDCVNEVDCVESSSGVYVRPGLNGNQIVGSGQAMQIRHTGQSYTDTTGVYQQVFVVYPPPANRVGYVRDTDLTPVPTTDCESYTICTVFDYDTPVYLDENSTTIIGRAWYSQLLVVGSPVNNRVPVTWGSQTAWLDLADLNVGVPIDCQVNIVCVQFNGDAYQPMPPNNGTAGTPTTPTPVLFTGKVHIDSGTTYREFTAAAVASPAWVETSVGYDVLPWTDCEPERECDPNSEIEACEPRCIADWIGEEWRARGIWTPPGVELHVTFATTAPHSINPLHVNPANSINPPNVGANPAIGRVTGPLALSGAITMKWWNPITGETGEVECKIPCTVREFLGDADLGDYLDELLPPDEPCEPIRVECTLTGNDLTIPDTSGGSTTATVSWTPSGKTLDLHYDWPSAPDVAQLGQSSPASDTALGYQPWVTITWYGPDGEAGIVRCQLCVSDIVFVNGAHECCKTGEPRIGDTGLCCNEGDVPINTDDLCCPEERVLANSCCNDGEIFDPQTGNCDREIVLATPTPTPTPPPPPPATPTPTPEVPPTPTPTPEPRDDNPPPPPITPTPTPIPVACGVDQVLEGGICLNVCADGTVDRGQGCGDPCNGLGQTGSGECRIICAPGVVDLGQCAGCIDGYQLANSTCEVICTGGRVAISADTCGCPAGTVDTGNGCQVVSTCPAGYVANGDTCQTPGLGCPAPSIDWPFEGTCISVAECQERGAQGFVVRGTVCSNE